jgi:hypothetical protein
LKLAFSLLRVSRSDPAERWLVRMLLASEPDLATTKGPLVFPVFGRGRALYALAGDGITDANLTKAADFLTAACSCKVKAANPGTDLLIAADWPDAPDISSTAPTSDDDAVTVPLPTKKPRPTPTAAALPSDEAGSGRGWLIAGILTAALGVLLSGARIRRGRDMDKKESAVPRGTLCQSSRD